MRLNCQCLVKNTRLAWSKRRKPVAISKCWRSADGVRFVRISGAMLTRVCGRWQWRFKKRLPSFGYIFRSAGGAPALLCNSKEQGMQLGMVGLGRMGSNMTRRLMRGGHQLVVSDLSADAVKQLAGEGAGGASSLEDRKSTRLNSSHL